jgi:hypothetical protein
MYYLMINVPITFNLYCCCCNKHCCSCWFVVACLLLLLYRYSWRGTSCKNMHDAVPWFFFKRSRLNLLEWSYTSNTVQKSATLEVKRRKFDVRTRKEVDGTCFLTVTIFTNLNASSGCPLAPIVTTKWTYQRTSLTCTCILQWKCMVQEQPSLFKWRPTTSNSGLLSSTLLMIKSWR